MIVLDLLDVKITCWGGICHRARLRDHYVLYENVVNFKNKHLSTIICSDWNDMVEGQKNNNILKNKIRISDIKNHNTCGLVINNVESLLGLDRPHLFSENKAPDSSWKAFFPADAVLSPLNKHWGDPERLWLLIKKKKKIVKMIM